VENGTATDSCGGRPHTAVVRLLLEAEGIIADLKDNCHTPPGAGYEDIVKLLLAWTNVDAARTHAMQQKALSHTARGGLDSLVRLLFAAVRVDPYPHDSPWWARLFLNTTYMYSNTALELLSQVGSTETILWRVYSAAAMIFRLGAGNGIVGEALRSIAGECFRRNTDSCIKPSGRGCGPSGIGRKLGAMDLQL
jgi:hypothetical protein